MQSVSAVCLVTRKAVSEMRPPFFSRSLGRPQSIAAKNTLENFGQAVQLRYTGKHFMGCRFGLFNFVTQTDGGDADIDYYLISPNIESVPAAAQ